MELKISDPQKTQSLGIRERKVKIDRTIKKKVPRVEGWGTEN